MGHEALEKLAADHFNNEFGRITSREVTDAAVLGTAMSIQENAVDGEKIGLGVRTDLRVFSEFSHAMNFEAHEAKYGHISRHL